MSSVSIDEFLKLPQRLLLDVRSPGEFSHAHMPEAISAPLFSDAQRAEIGTLYKQKGKENAMLHALDYYGSNMKLIVAQLDTELKRLQKHEDKEPKVVVQCWRGGMRSGVVCWMLELFGYNVLKLEGGYKSFRRWVLQQLELDYPVCILGGYTGSAKTETLHALAQQSQQTIDLESLARHKGSAFGGLNQPEPVSQEQFENELAWQLKILNSHQAVWFEDESQRIGTNTIPNKLWEHMRNATVYFLDVPFERRLQHLVESYGKIPVPQLIDATVRIRKKLGGLMMQQTIDHLDKKQFHDAFSILLRYYDKAYEEGLNKRRPGTIIKIPTDAINANVNAEKLIQASQK